MQSLRYLISLAYVCSSVALLGCLIFQPCTAGSFYSYAAHHDDSDNTDLGDQRSNMPAQIPVDEEIARLCQGLHALLNAGVNVEVEEANSVDILEAITKAQEICTKVAARMKK